MLYAKSVLNDPAKKGIYKQVLDRSKAQNTYNVAFADVLNSPDIESINLSAYMGKIGDVWLQMILV